MSCRKTLLGAVLAFLFLPSLAHASLEVRRIRVYTKTMQYPSYAGHSQNWRFKIYDGETVKGSWTQTNERKAGESDEVTIDVPAATLYYPDNIDKIVIENLSTYDSWRLKGLKVDISTGVSSGGFYTIYANRGLNKWISYYAPFSTERANAGSTTNYDDYHEAFWIVKLDGDRSYPNPDEDRIDYTSSQVRISLGVDNGSYVAGHYQNLINSGIWEPNPLDEEDQWSWYWTSFSGDALADYDKSELKLTFSTTDKLKVDEYFVAATQSWPYNGDTPYFKQRVFQTASGTLTTSGSAIYTSSNSQYKNWVYYKRYSEPWRDTEHTKRQEPTSCGPTSVGMVMATRGFDFPDGFDEDDIREQIHRWALQTMCSDTGDMNETCNDYSADRPDWWTCNRCVIDLSNDKLCDWRYYFEELNEECRNSLPRTDHADYDGTISNPDPWTEGTSSQPLMAYLEDAVSGSTVYRGFDNDCGSINPHSTYIGGGPFKVSTALEYGYGVIINSNSDFRSCSGAHWGVVASYELLADTDVFMINDPNGAITGIGSGDDYTYEGIDKRGITATQFQSNVRIALVWDYDFYE